jgi:hypothetical protein
MVAAFLLAFLLHEDGIDSSLRFTNGGEMGCVTVKSKKEYPS